MKRTDIEDTTANREVTDSAATRPRDGRDPFENARDTRDDVDDARRTAGNGGAARADAAEADATAQKGSNDTGKSLLPSDSLSEFQSRWQQIQVGFVDEPQTAVRDAEKLVNDVVAQLTKLFTQERENLEKNWNRGSDASTEDLRVALQRYRSFFQRLLAA